MPRVGFEHTIPAFERAKTFHVLDRAATVMGNLAVYWHEIPCIRKSWSSVPVTRFLYEVFFFLSFLSGLWNCMEYDINHYS
jgi:hypothetical protein